MPNYKPLYVDTDSATQEAYTKQVLNSIYGTLGKGATYMNREYISVSKANNATHITCVGDVFFHYKGRLCISSQEDNRIMFHVAVTE